MKNFSPQMRLALTSILHDAQHASGVFDVYAAAVGIREALPQELVKIDELVDWMLTHLGGIEAVEISPPGLIIDVLLSVDDDDEVGFAWRKAPENVRVYVAKEDALAA